MRVAEHLSVLEWLQRDAEAPALAVAGDEPDASANADAAYLDAVICVGAALRSCRGGIRLLQLHEQKQRCAARSRRAVRHRVSCRVAPLRRLRPGLFFAWRRLLRCMPFDQWAVTDTESSFC